MSETKFTPGPSLKPRSEAPAMADLTEKLTFEQSVMLTYLKERQGVAGFIRGPKMAMLRRLEARELVTCSKHGVWRITEAGKAALSARGER